MGLKPFNPAVHLSDVEPGFMLRLKVPHWFKRQDFIEWLNKYTNPDRWRRRHATWHTGGEPGEYSDIFITYDQGEVDDVDVLPEWAWGEITAVCEASNVGYAVIWLVNEDSDHYDIDDEEQIQPG